MPRTSRLEIPGGLYHVMTRGIERRKIFNDDEDRKEFLRRFEKNLTANGARCYAWALMPNHIHLVVRTGVKPLGSLMGKLLTGYAIYYNSRHKRVGHLYQNRYKAILCQDDIYFKELVRYVHLNPIRGKIVGTMDSLSGYKWGGHSALTGKIKQPWQDTEEVLSQFSANRKQALKAYEAFVQEGGSKEDEDLFSGGGLRRSAGGWRGVWELKRGKERWAYDSQILGDGDFVVTSLKQAGYADDKASRIRREGWTIERVLERVSEVTGVPREAIRHRGKGAVSGARMLVALWSYRELGKKLSEVADYFGISIPSAHTAVKKGTEYEKSSGYKLII